MNQDTMSNHTPAPEARKPKNEAVRRLFRSRPLGADPTKTVFTCTGCDEDVQTALKANVTRLTAHALKCESIPIEKKIECGAETQVAKRILKRKQPLDNGDEGLRGRSLQLLDSLLGRKRCRKTNKNETIRSFFVASPCDEDSSKTVLTCSGCGKVVQVAQRNNVTRLTEHVMKCDGISEEARSACIKASQKDDGCDAQESDLDLVGSVSVPSDEVPVPEKLPLSLKEQASKLIQDEVEGLMARFEPLGRLCDPFIQMGIKMRNPFASGLMPKSVVSIFSNWASPIEQRVLGELRQIIHKDMQMLSVSAVTVPVRSKTLLALIVNTQTYGYMESLVDIDDQESISTALESVVNIHSGHLACIAFDADTQEHIERALVNVRSSSPSALSKVVAMFNPWECIDMLHEKLFGMDPLSGLLAKAREIQNFVSQEKINELVSALQEEGACLDARFPEDTESTHLLGTNVFDLALAYRSFIELVGNQDHFGMIGDYFQECDEDGRRRLQSLFHSCTFEFWTSLGHAKTLFKLLEEAKELLVSKDTPLSAFFPTLVAVSNEATQVISCMMGCGMEGSCHLMIEMSRLLGLDGDEKGFLTKEHLWAFMVDPCRSSMSPQPVVSKGGEESQWKQMTSFYIPGTGDEQTNTRSRVCSEIERFDSRTSEWKQEYAPFASASALSHDALVDEQKRLTLATVKTWLVATGGQEARVQWVEDHTDTSEFVYHIARPILSMRSGVSYRVKRAVETTFKNLNFTVWSDLDDEQLYAMIRGGVNLRCLFRMKDQSTVQPIMDGLFGKR